MDWLDRLKEICTSLIPIVVIIVMLVAAASLLVLAIKAVR